MNSHYISMEDIPTDFKEIVEAIGMDAAVKLVKVRGGESIYVPKFTTLTRQSRNRAILSDFNGRNHRELAKRYSLTISMVRKIIEAASGNAKAYQRVASPKVPGSPKVMGSPKVPESVQQPNEGEQNG